MHVPWKTEASARPRRSSANAARATFASPSAATSKKAGAAVEDDDDAARDAPPLPGAAGAAATPEALVLVLVLALAMTAAREPCATNARRRSLARSSPASALAAHVSAEALSTWGAPGRSARGDIKGDEREY